MDDACKDAEGNPSTRIIEAKRVLAERLRSIRNARSFRVGFMVFGHSINFARSKADPTIEYLKRRDIEQVQESQVQFTESSEIQTA